MINFLIAFDGLWKTLGAGGIIGAIILYFLFGSGGGSSGGPSDWD